MKAGKYYAGYWDGTNGRVDHDHAWDKNYDHKRDYDRAHHDH
jgi:hypothetical protein